MFALVKNLFTKEEPKKEEKKQPKKAVKAAPKKKTK